MGAPGRLLGMPAPRLGQGPVLKAARQHLDGLDERLHLCLKPVHALLKRGFAGGARRWLRRCVHDVNAAPLPKGRPGPLATVMRGSRRRAGLTRRGHAVYHGTAHVLAPGVAAVAAVRVMQR